MRWENRGQPALQVVGGLAAADIRPFQENKPPKYKLSSEEKASGLEGFKFWNYLT
jgi:hypothetical protein